MDNKIKANTIRTILLLKISSEISDFKNSKTLINSKSPIELYDIYNNINIIIENQFEYSPVKSKEFLRKFSDSNLIKYDNINENETPYFEAFKEINKIIISEKKNQNFLNNLNNVNNNFEEQSSLDTTIKRNKTKLINDNDNKGKIKSSLNYLRGFVKNLIIKKKKPKKKENSFYKNSTFKSQSNLHVIHRKTESFAPSSTKNIKIYGEIIIENSPVIFCSGFEEKKNSGVSFYKNESYKSTRNLSKNTWSKISFNLSTFKNKKDNTSKFFPKSDKIVDRINPFISSQTIIKFNQNL
jgi:hypothetical protein